MRRVSRGPESPEFAMLRAGLRDRLAGVTAVTTTRCGHVVRGEHHMWGLHRAEWQRIAQGGEASAKVRGSEGGVEVLLEGTLPFIPLTPGFDVTTIGTKMA